MDARPAVRASPFRQAAVVKTKQQHTTRTSARRARATAAGNGAGAAAKPRRKPRAAGAVVGRAKRAARELAARRNFIVFVSLIGLLSFTSALLLALAPDPLAPTGPASLFALDAPASMDDVFRTRQPVETGRWRYIFVHQSRTPAGNTSLLAHDGQGPADHFIIGNGEGAIDGEIQLTGRWDAQTAAGAINGLERMDPGCISICLVGDLDRAAPTPTQGLRLGQLVSTLQRRLNISADRILLIEGGGTTATAGATFPVETFRSQLLH